MYRQLKIKQRDISDCGAACLASICIYYKLHYPISRIRQYAGTDKQGTNLLGLIEAAERLGFQAKGAKATAAHLATIPVPAIAHIFLKTGLHHYVVIQKCTKKKITYMDPGDGEFHRISVEQFMETWTGVLLLLLPGSDFVSGKHQSTNAQRFWNLIKPHFSSMVQAFIGALVYTILGLSTSIYMQKVIDFVLVEGNTRLLNLLSVAMIAILIVQLIIGGYKTVIGLQTGQMIDARLILGYYKHLLNLPQRFFDTMRVGEIMSRVNDAVKIREFINSVALNFLVNGLIVVFSILLMFFYYWKLALLMLTILPFYMIIYWITNSVNKKWQRKLMENSAELESQMVESLNAVGTIKRFGLERFINEKTADRFTTVLESIYKVSIYSLYIGTGSEFITRLFTILLLWLGSYFVISNELSTGELLSFYALIGYFTGPASSLISANRSIQEALIAADRLFEIIDLETEGTDEAKLVLTPVLVGDIEFIEVAFRYGNRCSVFNNLHLRIEKGRSTAIVGESGSGKSTILSLIQNLYPLQAGKITIGGLDLQHISKHSLRQIVGVVPQQIDLFTGSILENIAVGDEDPDLGRILFLSKMLGIDSFIEKLPNTYNSVVTEQGMNFSGGQKQRIAIARVLYRNPEILILDEATSSLDPASEHKVQETLEWYKSTGKTIIVIAHRLSTIKNCDQILVLNKGVLVEQGTHQDLVEKEGYYSDLWSYHSATIQA